MNFNTNKNWKLYSARNPIHILGKETNQLTISNHIFKEELNLTLFWKFELIAIYTNQSNTATVSTSMIIMINELPVDGHCDVSPSIGYLAYTEFSISCHNWQDKNGKIEFYEYYGLSLWFEFI